MRPCAGPTTGNSADYCPLHLTPEARSKERTEIKNNFHLERWFLNQVEAHIRRQPSGEKTSECCDDTFLGSYSAKPRSFSLSDPRVEHVTSCNYCLPRLLEIRESREAAPRPRMAYLAVAAVALGCLLVGFLSATVWNRRHVVPAQSAAVRRTLDLSNYGTYRGDAAEAQPSLALPVANLKLKLILPRLSHPGVYFVAVATDTTGQHGIALANGTSVTADQKTVVTVPLDLRAARPGNYVLSTQRQGEEAPYYYRVTIQ